MHIPLLYIPGELEFDIEAMPASIGRANTNPNRTCMTSRDSEQFVPSGHRYDGILMHGRDHQLLIHACISGTYPCPLHSTIDNGEHTAAQIQYAALPQLFYTQASTQAGAVLRVQYTFNDIATTTGFFAPAALACGD